MATGLSVGDLSRCRWTTAVSRDFTGAAAVAPNTPQDCRANGEIARPRRHSEWSVKPSAQPTQVRTLDMPRIYPQVRPGPVGRASCRLGAVCVTVGHARRVRARSSMGRSASCGGAGPMEADRRGSWRPVERWLASMRLRRGASLASIPPEAADASSCTTAIPPRVDDFDERDAVVTRRTLLTAA